MSAKRINLLRLPLDHLTVLVGPSAAAVYPENTKPEAVIESLEIIISNLKLRINKKSQGS